MAAEAKGDGVKSIEKSTIVSTYAIFEAGLRRYDATIQACQALDATHKSDVRATGTRANEHVYSIVRSRVETPNALQFCMYVLLIIFEYLKRLAQKTPKYTLSKKALHYAPPEGALEYAAIRPTFPKKPSAPKPQLSPEASSINLQFQDMLRGVSQKAVRVRSKDKPSTLPVEVYVAQRHIGNKERDARESARLAATAPIDATTTVLMCPIDDIADAALRILVNDSFFIGLATGKVLKQVRCTVQVYREDATEEMEQNDVRSFQATAYFAQANMSTAKVVHGTVSDDWIITVPRAQLDGDNASVQDDEAHDDDAHANEEQDAQEQEKEDAGNDQEQEKEDADEKEVDQRRSGRVSVPQIGLHLLIIKRILGKTIFITPPISRQGSLDLKKSVRRIAQT